MSSPNLISLLKRARSQIKKWIEMAESLSPWLKRSNLSNCTELYKASRSSLEEESLEEKILFLKKRSQPWKKFGFQTRMLISRTGSWNSALQLWANVFTLLLTVFLSYVIQQWKINSGIYCSSTDRQPEDFV